jgi:hypothetical protein
LNQIKSRVVHSEDPRTVRYPYDQRRFVAMCTDEDMWMRTVGQFASHLIRDVHALSAHEAGCTQEARHTAADMSVLWGGGNLASRVEPVHSRFPVRKTER